MTREEIVAHVRANWTSARPAPLNGLSIDEKDQIAGRIEHSGAGLPAPFHRGMSLGFVAHTSVSDLHHVLQFIVDRTPEASDLVRVQGDRLHALAAKTDIVVDGYAPCRLLRQKDGTFALDVITQVSALNASGTREDFWFTIGETGFGDSGWTNFKRLASAQKQRRIVGGRGLVTDPVMAKALATLTKRQITALLEHLRTMPEVPDDMKTLSMEACWNKSTIRRCRVSLPEAVETIQVRNGVIVGRVRMTPNTTWNAGTMVHSGKTVPHSVAMGLDGRRVDEVVSHPWLTSDIVIASATVDRRNRLRMKTRYDAVEVTASSLAA